MSLNTGIKFIFINSIIDEVSTKVICYQYTIQTDIKVNVKILHGNICVLLVLETRRLELFKI